MELWFTEKHTPNVRFSIKVDRQLYSGKSEFQRIDIFDSSEFGRFLTLDGYMMLTEKDEFIYHVLGENFAEKYIRAKKAEWQDYTMQVTKWEIDQYLYKI